MKALLIALAALVASPAAAQADLRVIFQTNPDIYHGYYYDYSYRGPLRMTRDGYYLCRRHNGRWGILVDRYGRAISRWNYYPRYYSRSARLHCAPLYQNR